MTAGRLFFTGGILFLILCAGFSYTAMAQSAPTTIPPTISISYYVAPDGNDAYTGTLPYPNTAKTDGPFATLTQAQKTIRQQKAKTQSVCRFSVIVNDGVYVLTQPLTFEPEDSGSDSCPVTYAAAPNSRPTLSGGLAITGWQLWKNHIWRCDLKPLGLASLTETNLYYNNRRQPLARVPNLNPDQPYTAGFLYPPMSFVAENTARVKENNTEGTLAYDPADWRTWQQAPTSKEDEGSKQVLLYDPATLDPTHWADIDKIWVHMAPFHNWTYDFIPLKEIDAKNHQMLLARECHYPLIRDTRFYFTNILAELDAPGEWFLDSKESMLYFRPPDDAGPDGKVVITTLAQIVAFSGRPDKKEFVHDIHFSGFDLRNARGGFALTLTAAEHCRIANNIITNVTHGIALDGNSHDNQIIGNDIAHITGNALSMSGKNNLADNNYIHDIIPFDAYSGSAANVGGTQNTFRHNLIHDVPALGIGFSGYDNVMEYNDIHHVGLATTLGGGIYSHAAKEEDAAKIKGNIIRFNKISDVVGYGMAAPGEWGSDPGWGIWLDDFINDTEIYGNIIVRNARGGVQLHGGKRNRFENNILNAGIPSTINHIKKGTEPCNNIVEHNIICYTNPDPVLVRRYGRVVKGLTGLDTFPAAPIFLCGWHIIKDAIALSDNNLFYPIAGRAADRLHYFEGAGDEATGTWSDAPIADRFDWWRSLGYDPHSVTADPKFADLESDNFNLPADSPAIKLGFKPLPLDQIGPYASSDRASWPLPDHHKKWRENKVQPYASFIH